MDKNNWDLECLLNGGTIEQLYQEWYNSNEEELKLYNNFLDSLENFKNWTKLLEKNIVINNRISNYIFNKLHEDCSNNEMIGWEQKLNNVENEFSVKMSDYANKIMKNEEKIREYLEDEELKKYTRKYENFFRYKKYILNEEQNLMLTKTSKYGGGIHEVFSTLTTEDIKFNDVLDSKNKKHKIITPSDAIKLLHSNDRVLRKNTWISYNLAYANISSTLSKTIYYNYLQLNTNAKIHNYEDYFTSTCFSDEINPELVTNLYKHVLNFKKIYIKFSNKLKKTIKLKNNIKKVEPWDSNKYIEKIKSKITIEDGKKITLEALNILGDEYIEKLKSIFNENWISWLPKKNKYSGAYSIDGTKGLDKYYILMNWNDDIDSISTLVHELGHSMNSWFYTKAQPVYCSTTIFVAEIPSTLNELLLKEYLINKYSNNKKIQNYLILELLNDFFGTTTRQIIFSKWEYEINKMINNNENFNKDIGKKIYNDLNNDYMGKKIKSSYPYNLSLNTIYRIPHFYSGNFYVYKYAIGMIVSINVLINIKKDKNYLQTYFKFLESGTSLSPVETIKILGVDLYEKTTYENVELYITNLLKKIR